MPDPLAAGRRRGGVPAPGLALGGGAHYLGIMALPRPASPRVLWEDLRAFARERSRYQWVSLVGALVMPVALLWLFVLDSESIEQPAATVVFVDSWSAARNDEEIKAAQAIRQREREKQDEERRQAWKRLGDRTGVNP
jgi:hypothetical protein